MRFAGAISGSNPSNVLQRWHPESFVDRTACKGKVRSWSRQTLLPALAVNTTNHHFTAIFCGKVTPVALG